MPKASTLSIGVVPLVEELVVKGKEAWLQPGSFELRPSVSQQTFSVVLNASDTRRIIESAREAIRFLATRGTQIVVFPEMVVPDVILAAIQKELRDLYLSGERVPSLVLGGTFARPHPDARSKVGNVAVVLNGRGDVLWSQAKLHRYEMKDYEQGNFGLAGVFGAVNREEEIDIEPRIVRIVDLPKLKLRVSVLICEDACQYGSVEKPIRWKSLNNCQPVRQLGLGESLEDPLQSAMSVGFTAQRPGAPKESMGCRSVVFAESSVATRRA